jgi:phage shock protein C
MTQAVAAHLDCRDSMQRGLTGTEWSLTMADVRKLYRSRTNRQVAGVCGGLAEHFNMDATLIRVLFVVLAVLGGSGIIIYIAMWIIVPQEP